MKHMNESSRSLLWTAWCLLLSLGLQLTEGATQRMAKPDASPWFERFLVGMEVGPTGAQSGSEGQDVDFARRFNGRDIVQASVRAHAQYIVMWGRDSEWTYYNSKIEPKAPGLGDRDVLQETVDEARKHDMPVIVYCVLQYPNQTLRKHADWKARDHNGSPINHLVCFNSPYRDYVKGLLAEMAAYGIDGFHLDMVDQGFGPPHGCWCDTCQNQFEAKYGHAMPKGVTWDQAWDHMLEFRYDTSDRFEKDLTAYVRQLSPKLTVDYNYHGNPPFAWEVGQRPVQHADNSDFVTGETGTWAFGALAVGLNAEFYRAATPGVPVQVAMQRSVRMYHDQTTRPLNDIRWELFTLLAHGTFVTMIDKTAFDGWLDPVVYERTGSAFKEALAKREHFGQTPVAEVGLYYSSRSRDWLGRDKPLAWMQSFLGAHKAMVYEHISFGILHDESVTLDRLQAFPVVLIPNAGILSQREVTLLRQYVEVGGRLILTGQTGLYGPRGNPLTQSAVSDLAGVKLVKRMDAMDNWVRLTRNDNAKLRFPGPIRNDWPFMVKGPATVFKATTAQPIGDLMQPHRTLLQKQGKQGTDWPMSADRSVGPAMLMNRVGQGTVLTLAMSPGHATASDHHVVEARRLLRHAVRFLNPRPVIDVTAPATVEAVVTEDIAEKRLRIHLIAYNAPPQTTPVKERPYVLPGLIEDTPMYRASIQLNRPFAEVTAVNSATQIKVSGQTIDVLVEDIHDVIVINY